MAVTIMVTRIAEILQIDQTRAQELLAVATELVNEWAPATPDNISNEAAIRVAGYLHQQPMAARSWSQTGPLLVRHQVNNLSCWRHSGAAALCAPYVTRRVL